MDNKDELIWRYIDEEMGEEDEKQFLASLDSDLETAREFEISSQLHGHLLKMYNHRAPKRLLIKIMNHVDDIKVLERSAARSIFVIVIIMVLVGTTSLFIPEGNGEWLSYIHFDWVDSLLASRAVSIFAWISMTVLGFILLDYFVLRRRVPK